MPGSRYRGRRKGVRIKEGSVSRARRELRLSLADVAGNQLSRTAVHLIEHGRVNPSLQTLRLIARRLNKPIEYFLVAEGLGTRSGPQPQIQQLENLTAVRDFEAVISSGEGLIKKRWGKRDRALLSLYVGEAYCRLVRPNEAIPHLRLARTTFDQLDDEAMAVEALDWEAAALGLIEDPTALAAAGEALDRCRKLDARSLQLEARILGHIAGMYVVRQSWKSAISYYEEAAAAAGRVKDLLQLAKMHHGLGGAYKRMGDAATARHHYDRALTFYSLESDRSATFRVENDLGDLYLQQGMLDAAEVHLQKALAGSEELKIERRGRGFILVGLGELHLRKGEHEKAREYLSRALNSARTTGEGIVTAEAHTLLAKVEEQLGRASNADEEFLRAIFILEQLQMPDRLRECHMQYAEALEARGDIREAAKHWRSAAEIGRAAVAGADLGTTATGAAAADAAGA